MSKDNHKVELYTELVDENLFIEKYVFDGQFIRNAYLTFGVPNGTMMMTHYG